MLLKNWDELPSEMKVDDVKKYYDILKRKKLSLFFKRLFDILVSFTMLIFLSPIFLLLAIAIKIDSPGPVFYRQERVTTYGKRFYIHKFRTMVNNADKNGSLVTVKNDNRITKVGKLIRKCRLDEICQLIDVLCGNMTFVGTRPEVIKYVEKYEPVMFATLLLPAGITSEASIFFKDEDKLLSNAENVDDIYINNILPQKMSYNLKSIENFSFVGDIKIMIMTIFAVLGKNYVVNNVEEKANNEFIKK